MLILMIMAIITIIMIAIVEALAEVGQRATVPQHKQ